MSSTALQAVSDRFRPIADIEVATFGTLPKCWPRGGYQRRLQGDFVISSSEKRILLSCLKRIDNPRGGIAGTRWFLIILWIGLVLSATALMVISHWVRVEVVMFASLLLGMIYCYAYVCAAAARVWPLLAKYVDREAMERRLRELGA